MIVGLAFGNVLFSPILEWWCYETQLESEAMRCIRNIRKMFLAVLCCISLLPIVEPAAAASVEKTFVVIGTGGVTGVYYPTGGAICRFVNKGKKGHGVRCLVESTEGSVANTSKIAQGELVLAVVQSDVQSQAYKGVEKFAVSGPVRELRSLFSVHAEPFNVVVRADSGINRFQDLKDKRVNIGNPGSGQRNAMDILMGAFGWDPDTFKLAAELKPSEQAVALCDNRIDAFVYMVGVPNGSVKEATTSCDAILVEVQGEEIDKLVAENSYYRMTTIPGGVYRGTDNDVYSFGVAATLIASATLSDKVVYEIVKAVFENFEEFKKLHPAFANLKKQEMVSTNLTAPLHDGAVKYYKEVGLL